MSWKYTAISGFFIHDDTSVDPISIGALPKRFGLLDDSEDRWANFKAKIGQLNANASEGTSYKFFLLGRHGQGYHNVAEEKYGTKSWDAYWSKLNGDDELTWGPDALLTPTGKAQALDARAAWEAELEFGIPIPQKFYSSPLRRALDTWTGTFGGESATFSEEKRQVLILENCREEYGEHTCDLRSTLSTLRAIYPPPVYSFEPGFTEDDPVWKPDEREAKTHITARATDVLNTVFAEPSPYISITSHGGFINGFLSAIGRPYYALPTGGVLPVIVKGTKVPNTHGAPTAQAISEY